MNNVFMIATKEKFRYEYHGNITTEDLWGLSLEALDSIHIALRQKMNRPESLLSATSKKDEILQMKDEIVTTIVNAKLAEIENMKNELKKRETKKQIMKIIGEKENAELASKSVDELKKILETM